jgi:hypothetical protein
VGKLVLKGVAVSIVCDPLVVENIGASFLNSAEHAGSVPKTLPRSPWPSWRRATSSTAAHMRAQAKWILQGGMSAASILGTIVCRVRAKETFPHVSGHLGHPGGIQCLQRI